MCLGGHLAYRCALDPRVAAAVCYFATDIHSATLGAGKSDDSLQRAGDIKGELVMIFGKMDNHVPPEGRDLIRRTLHEKGVLFSFYEPAWAQREFLFPFDQLLGSFMREMAWRWRIFGAVDANICRCVHPRRAQQGPLRRRALGRVLRDAEGAVQPHAEV